MHFSVGLLRFAKGWADIGVNITDDAAVGGCCSDTDWAVCETLYLAAQPGPPRQRGPIPFAFGLRVLRLISSRDYTEW